MGLAAAQIALGPALTETQARAIFAQGEDAVVFALLQLPRQLALQASAAAGSSHETPATPSGMKPPFAKPAATGRKKRPGREAGPVGSRRQRPARIDERQTHRAEVCPGCGGSLNRCAETRVRHTEDIRHTPPIVTEHTIHRDGCPRRRKKVEPVVPTALPGSPFGHRMLALTAWLHDALGNTLSQVVDVFDFHLPLRVTPGGLVQMWARLAEVLQPWCRQIHEEALKSAVLHGDESGGRVNGKTHWLWGFANPVLSDFMIDRSRGQPALRKFFTEEFSVLLVSDFWGADTPWRGRCVRRAWCICCATWNTSSRTSPRESAGRPSPRNSGGWSPTPSACGGAPTNCPTRLTPRAARLDDLIGTPWQDRQARRLIKRLRRHQSDLFTFLDHPGVPFDNNLAERSIRPAVIIRKTSYGNRSDQGAEVQALLMSILFTLKKRGHHPIHTIETALITDMKTGQLPPLPTGITADG